MSMETVASEGRVVGEWQKPVNRWQGAENSIHTDAVAKRVGMRGGTIPGTVHLTHFPALLNQLFGDRWLKQGSISMFYTFATTDGEPVRAIVKAPPQGATDVQLDAWVENEEGRVVCKGTVAVGKPDATPYVRSLPLDQAAPDAIRILKGVEVGMELPSRDDFLIARGSDDGVVRDPQVMYGALAGFPAAIKTAPAVGFFGATEIVLHAGPLRTDTPYRKSGKVAGYGASPKTEFIWLDSFLHDQDGHLIAEMRHMTRWMKISSPLWTS
jgi:hypothetical protein